MLICHQIDFVGIFRQPDEFHPVASIVPRQVVNEQFTILDEAKLICTLINFRIDEWSY